MLFARFQYRTLLQRLFPDAGPSIACCNAAFSSICSMLSFSTPFAAIHRIISHTVYCNELGALRGLSFFDQKATWSGEVHRHFLDQQITPELYLTRPERSSDDRILQWGFQAYCMLHAFQIIGQSTEPCLCQLSIANFPSVSDS